ncbi:hypothetical protein ISE1_2632 [plant metagenome]|uniref:N-acetyltransferase domain-containing protein n=1 Tax=plant metagenome TaxID=1297885 RepID=A0A484UX80_9ZZZZ
MSGITAQDVQHSPAQSRFDVTVDGQLCVLEYLLQDKVMTITHTGVPGAVGGRGIAGALTRKALDTARAQGWKVRPACSYAAAYFQRHGEDKDLLAS